MTVAELIAHLQTLPQHAEVQCLQERQAMWNTFFIFEDLTPEGINVIDFRNNPFVTEGHPNYNRIFVEIGLPLV